MRSIVIAAALVAALLLPASASATANCGTETAWSHEMVFAIKAKGVPCSTAKNEIAGGWFHVQSSGDSADTIYDRKGRAWSCKITRSATGTDPGYDPYTHVRCKRPSKWVKFKLRS